jgi:hypothetical protein
MTKFVTKMYAFQVCFILESLSYLDVDNAIT